MLANGLGQITERAEAIARGPATPPVEFSFGKLAVGVNGLGSLTQTHRSTKFGVLTREIFTLLLTLFTQVPSVAAQAPTLMNRWFCFSRILAGILYSH